MARDGAKGAVGDILRNSNIEDGELQFVVSNDARAE